MENKNLTCIGCPMGCLLTVTYDINDPSNITVTGNTCNRGKLYGITEVTSPTRTVTGTVKVANRHNLVVSVKTQNPIPKDLVLTLANYLNELSVNAPVHIGDIVEENICNTGVNFIVTKNII